MYLRRINNNNEKKKKKSTRKAFNNVAKASQKVTVFNGMSIVHKTVLMKRALLHILFLAICFRVKAKSNTNNNGNNRIVQKE